MNLVLLLLLIGSTALAIAWRMNRTSSFDDGSFFRQMVLTLVGIICVAIGLIVGAAKLFMLSPMLLALFAVPAAVVVGGIVIVNRARTPPASYFGMGLVIIGVAMAVVLMLAISARAVHARDLDGRYAGSPLKAWFDSLHSGKGPCCSDADGTALSDVDWESKDGHYRVRIEGVWWDVPNEAVITEPNRAGRTMVWPSYYRAVDTSLQRVDIRCFMPGSMT